MRSFYGGLSYEKLKEARKGDIFLVPVKPPDADTEVMCFKGCMTEFEVLYKTNEKILLHANTSICSTIINDTIADWENTALCRYLEKLSKTFPIKNKCTILSAQEIKNIIIYFHGHLNVQDILILLVNIGQELKAKNQKRTGRMLGYLVKMKSLVWNFIVEE